MRPITDNRFPTSGLLWDYKPFILKETKKYSDRYWLPFEDVLDHAIYLAAIAEKRFNPHLGHDFATFLHWHLKGLHRFCKQEFRRNNIFWDGRLEPKQEPTDRCRARLEYGDDRGRIDWSEHLPALLDLDRHQKDSLRLAEKAVLDWMIEPDGRKLSQVAAWVGVSKGYASKIRYRLLHKSHSLPRTVAA
jgi:hypothetical protein